MTTKKSFATIFTDTENFHLVKDVGQVPYFIYKTGLYEAELVTYKNTPAYPYLENEVKGLKLSFINKAGKFIYAQIAVLKFLLVSSKRIHVLNLFHFKKDNILYLLVYKSLNPKGKVYVKLDMDTLFFKKYNSFFFSNYWLKNQLLKVITQLHFKLTDLFSVETDEAVDYLLEVYPELQDKLICVPNGVDNEFIDDSIEVKTFEQKENIILTVGRIGTVQKNTELFLEALLLTDLQDWKVYIVGPIANEFEPYMDNYFQTNPQLKERIFFTGNITDRKEIFEWYNRAKIFCMTSRFEGFPIAFSEALYFGNYIITTPLSSSSFVTDNELLGCIAKANPPDIAGAIKNTITGRFLNAVLYQNIRNFAQLNLTWPRIIKRITSHLGK